MLLLFLGVSPGVALAEVPDIFAQAEPPDIASAYVEYAQGLGRTGTAAAIQCRLVADGLELCFRYVDHGRLRYVTAAELALWPADLRAVEAGAVHTATPAITAARFEQTAIADTEGGTYWVSRSGDGLDAAGLLFPDRLRDIAGGEVVVAIPSSGVLLFWRPGRAEVDRIMAVGVRRMMEASDHPVSASIYRWEMDRWKVWGEAVPAPSTPAPARIAAPDPITAPIPIPRQ